MKEKKVPIETIVVDQVINENHQPTNATKAENSRVFNFNVASELLFNLLPIIVIFFVQLFYFDVKEIFSLPEWSVISCILSGQLLVKLAHSDSLNESLLESQGILMEPMLPSHISRFLMTIFICFLFVPSLICLAFIFISQDALKPWMVVFQIFLFSLNVTAYLAFSISYEKFKRNNR